MDDRITGTEAPRIESQHTMNVLLSDAERRAFKRFHDGLAAAPQGSADHDSTLDIWLRDHSAVWHRRRQHTAAQMQAEEIRKHRWIESEKIQGDVGKDSHFDWVKAHAADWRHWFETHYDGPLEECD